MGQQVIYTCMLLGILCQMIACSLPGVLVGLQKGETVT